MSSKKLIVTSIVFLALMPVIFIGGILSIAMMGDKDANAACLDGSAPATGGPLSDVAQDAIPSNLIPIYHAAERRYNVPWNVLAAINSVETNFGRNLNVSSAGALGWMQFMPATWAAYGVDANGDGRKDPYHPKDAIYAAANYLKASGAPKDMRKAIFAYNHANWYVDKVLALATKYALRSPLGSPVSLGAACDLADTGVPGKVIIAPGANKPGQPIQKELMAFLAQVAGVYEKPIVISTGTNHSYLTVNGNVSDHAIGYGADFSMAANKWPTLNDPAGDRLATAALIVAGDPPAVAARNARIGMIHNRVHKGLKIQVIWRCSGDACGGDHTNHVHIGAKPV